jgi:hypothetical protein
MILHVYNSSAPRLPAGESSGTITCSIASGPLSVKKGFDVVICLVASDPASLLGMASVSSCVPWLYEDRVSQI